MMAILRARAMINQMYHGISPSGGERQFNTNAENLVQQCLSVPIVSTHPVGMIVPEEKKNKTKTIIELINT